MKRFPVKKERQEVLVETKIWECSNEQCVGWMRAEFTFQAHPQCPICSQDMVKATKVLPEIPKVYY